RMHEQEVLFVAVAAAAGLHELVLQRLHVEPDRPAEERIEVFERDRSRMRLVHRLQHGERRLARPLIADTPKIGVEVEAWFGRGGVDERWRSGHRSFRDLEWASNGKARTISSPIEVKPGAEPCRCPAIPPSGEA